MSTSSGLASLDRGENNATATLPGRHAIGCCCCCAMRLSRRQMKAAVGEEKLRGRELSAKRWVIGLGTLAHRFRSRAWLAHERIATIRWFTPARCRTAARAGQPRLAFSRPSLSPCPAADAKQGLLNDATSRRQKGVTRDERCARGIYDEASLLRGLESGQIGGADVFVESAGLHRAGPPATASHSASRCLTE